jgi:hypothetical protein
LLLVTLLLVTLLPDTPLPAPRLNTWREQRLNEDWRNNNWRTQRANQDWQQREDYTKQTTPNNAIDKGYVGGAAATDRTKTKPVDKDKDNNPTDKAVDVDYRR